jgi:carbonic anhydrase
MRPRFSRRVFMRMTGLVAASTSLGVTVSAADKPAAALSADKILAKLLAGNRRYMQGNLANPRRSPEDFASLEEGQNPVAVIVGCADSRVPPEVIFDQGVGDLFVIRVAGNVISGAGATVKGSVEYAVAELAVPLIVVLGHSRCGAVKAAIKHIDDKDSLPGSIEDLVENIRPAVTKAKTRSGDILENSIRANVERGAERLRTLDPIIADAVKGKKVKIVGATYDLRTGEVIVLG